MNFDFIYSRCNECHKLIDDDDYCTAYNPSYMPYDSLGRPFYKELPQDFLREFWLFEYFGNKCYLKCLACSVRTDRFLFKQFTYPDGFIVMLKRELVEYISDKHNFRVLGVIFK